MFTLRPMTRHVAQNLGDETVTEPAAETAKLHPLFAAYPVASLLYRPDGVIVAANAAALALFRCGTAQLRGAQMLSFLPELRDAFAVTQGVSHGRVAVRRPDGHNFIARVHFVPTLDPTAPLMANIEDLSDWEQEIAAANKELETFMSSAGHDLRGPLRILKGFTEALEDECGDVLNEEGRNFLKEILKAGDRMEGLIDGLLAYSRASRGELSCENLDLTTLVELVYYELRHTQPNRAVDCQVDAGLNAWGDVRLMMTVLRNLLGNAWKFTARNASASIRCHAEERDGRRWICVTDDGAGFDMTQATRLFKPFTRLHRQDEFPGHGMGLATAHRIVKRHRGEIEAESRPGEGTTVRFYLPAAD